MAGAKIVVLYPRPTDVAAFEAVYLGEHVPLAAAKIAGDPEFCFARIVDAPGVESPYHRVTEIRFPTIEALRRSLADPGTGEVAAHAMALSSGGPPIFLVCEHDNTGQEVDDRVSHRRDPRS